MSLTSVAASKLSIEKHMVRLLRVLRELPGLHLRFQTAVKPLLWILLLLLALLPLVQVHSVYNCDNGMHR
jgi:hypothetical protein